MTVTRRPPLVIRHWEYGVNLVTDAKWSTDFIRRYIAKHVPKHGDAVVYFNNSKMFGGSGSQPPKCRLYWNWHGQIVTCIPQVEEFAYKQVDYQHKLNAWLRRNFGVSTDLGEFFTEYTGRFSSYEERRTAAKKAAKKLAEKKLAAAW